MGRFILAGALATAMLTGITAAHAEWRGGWHGGGGGWHGGGRGWHGGGGGWHGGGRWYGGRWYAGGWPGLYIAPGPYYPPPVYYAPPPVYYGYPGP